MKISTRKLINKVKDGTFKGFHVGYSMPFQKSQEGIILGFGTDSIKIRKYPETWRGIEYIKPEWVDWITTNEPI